MSSQGGHPAAQSQSTLLGECDVRFTRRSGPGGQNRNKVETAVIATHRPTGLSAEANERRTQGENRDSAIFRLRLRLALEVRTNIGDRPSELWQSRCPGGRIMVNPSHEDFPSLLAEVLNVLADRDYDSKAAAEWLGCSSSQLVKFLKDEPRALALLNERRKAQGLRPLL